MSEHRCYGCMQLHDGDFCPHCGWPAGKNNEVHQLSVGTLLHGQYEIGRVLGQGGFGITYLGWDRQLGAAVCIKEYFPSHAVSRDCTVSNLVRCHTEAGAESFRLSKERFLREGRVLARFRDIPEIVSVYGSFEENDTVYIVMEYIKGMDLAHYVNHRGGRLSGEETFKILKPVMEALAQVHRSELVHRDIAPDNIMLHPRGGAKLLDFGAARMVENADVDKGLDRSTEAIVKHGFAPMEQYQTRGNLGPWTDVYAMCATVYYCLTGQIPPEATTRLMGESSFSWANVPGLTDRQRTALERGMAVLPKDRYRSMEELLDGLFGNAPMPMTYTEPVHTAPQPPVYAPQAPAYIPQAPAPRKRSKLVPILAGVLAAVALLVGGTLLALWVRENITFGSSTAGYAEPAPTEAPVAEAPRAEAVPEAIGPFEVGMIMKAGWMPVFPERLAEHLGNTGADVTLDIMSTTYESEMLAMAEAYVASGVDVLIVQGMDPAGIVAQKVAELTSAAGIQLLLLGTDPVYTQEGNDLMHTYENTGYIDADPRTLAVELVGSLMEAEKNGDGAISYLFLHSEDLGTVSDALAGMLPEELEKNGFNAALLEEVPGTVDHFTLEDTISRHRHEIEAIVCTDGETMSAAIEACASLGIDIKKDMQIIVLADCDTLPELYSKEFIGGYVTYGPKLLAEHVSFALEIIFEGAGIGGWYLPEGMDIRY